MEKKICNENLRKIRRLKGFSQEYIALKLRISQKAYSDIELGKTKMRKELLLKLSGVLDVSPFQICPISLYCNNKSERNLNKVLKYLKTINMTLPPHILEE